MNHHPPHIRRRRSGFTLHPSSFSLLPTAMAAMVAAGGCVRPPLRGTITPDEEASFRASAIECLKGAAFSSEPALRMNAIEALADVAPEEGLPCIALNIDNDYAGASFAALMALGSMKNRDFFERIRTRAEHPDPNVRIAALYALHQLGDRRRTGELADFLLKHRDARVRANAALAIGRLGEPSSVKLLRSARQNESKDLPKLQILEALAILGDARATEQLIADGHSAYPDQAALGLMFLANAKAERPEALRLYYYRLRSADHPEARLQAARALGRLGREDGLDVAVAHLWFNSPKRGWPNDPPEQQIARIRGLAALALEAIGSPDALKALKGAFELDGQPQYVRIAVARAAIRIIDRRRTPSAFSDRPSAAVARMRGER